MGFTSPKVDAFTCSSLHFSPLYCTFTNENRPALLELIFLAYLFRQLLPARSSCLESSAQEGFFRESGRKGRLANDRSEFPHWTISSSCVHVNLFSWVCVFACFFFLSCHFLCDRVLVVLFHVTWSEEDLSLDLYIEKSWQSSMRALLGSEGNSIAAALLVLSFLKKNLLLGKLLVTCPNAGDYLKAM